MKISTIYLTILNKPWFIDLRQIDSQALLIDKFINHEMAEYTTEILSDNHPLTVKAMDGDDDEEEINRFEKCKPGSIAIISMSGNMIKDGTWCSYGTKEIAAKIDEATDCENIDGIVLCIDSGGGAVDAIAPMVDAIQRAQSMGKPVVASCDLCASAAYYTAIYCDEIIADNKISSEFGSIGVMTQIADYEKYYEKEGVKVHTIYSDVSNYKNAAYEAAKKGEYDQIKKECLNPLAIKFQDAVKAQRKNLDCKVEGILNGKMFFAEDAKANGLIDDIGNMQYAISQCKKRCDEKTIQNFTDNY